MKAADLQPKHIENIVQLYEQHCGFNRDVTRILGTTFQAVCDMLNEGEENDGWRIGSQWDGQSKLRIFVNDERQVDAEFKSNFAPRDRQGPKYEEAIAAGKRFREAVKQLLQ